MIFGLSDYDNSKTQDEAGAICISLDLTKNKTLISCQLEFECVNNIVEYEALIFRLNKAIGFQVDCIMVIGDLEIISNQVCNTIHFLSPHLKNYQQEVWRLISSFKYFNRISVSKSRNATFDTLATAKTCFTPLRDGFYIKIVY